MTRSEWLRERYRIPAVGASDAANLLGVGYQDARAVFNDKMNPPDPDETPTVGWRARGMALEEIAARMYAEKMGGIDVASLAEPLVRHADREWQFNSVDRVRDDDRAVEIKTAVGMGDEWGQEGTDQIPDSYMPQVQHSLGVLASRPDRFRTDWCDVACLDIVEWRLYVYRVTFNPTFFDWLTGIEQQFMVDHLLPRVPPGADWGERFREPALGLLDRGRQVDLGDAGAVLAERYKRLAEVEKDAKDAKDKTREELRAMMAGAEKATAGLWTVRRSIIKGSTFTATRDDYEKLDIRAKKGGA